MPDFSVDSPTPVYVRVADWIESRITSGELKPGARLPPDRELASDFGVAYDTVRRAAALLRERGLIVTVDGRGTYVAEPPAQTSGPRAEHSSAGEADCYQMKSRSMTSAPRRSSGTITFR